MGKNIEFFDCAIETDMQKCENYLKSKTVTKNEVVMFPYIMLVWED